MTDAIQFERHTETAGFFSPLAGMEFAEDRVEVRIDPLTGMTAVASAGLEAKEEMFLGKTDWDYAEALAARTREGCFFCPEKVLEATPKYPDELVPGGRLERGGALVFPNLFPLAAVHAVVTFPEKHFLRPREFTPEPAGGSARRGVRLRRPRRALLPPPHAPAGVLQPHAAGGASLVHPHLQVFGGETVPWQVELYWHRSAEWAAAHGASYWETLVEQEETAGERSIWSAEGVHWLAPFAPAGAREAIAVVPGAGA